MKNINNMIKEFLKAAGCKTEEELMKKYPTEESFFTSFPGLKKMALGGQSSPTITPQDRMAWERMQSEAARQGYLGNDHNRQPGREFMQKHGVNPDMLSAYQQDFQQFSQTDPSRISYKDELSKVDNFYGHRTAKQRYRQHQYVTYKGDKEVSNFRTGTEPISKQEWDNRIGYNTPATSSTTTTNTGGSTDSGMGFPLHDWNSRTARQSAGNNQRTVRPKPTLESQGFLSKEEAIAAKKARKNNPDNWYLKKGGTYNMGVYFEPGGVYDPWQAINPNDPNTMNQVNQPVQDAMAGTIPVNNFGNNQTISPDALGNPDYMQPQSGPTPQPNAQRHGWGATMGAIGGVQTAKLALAESIAGAVDNKKNQKRMQKYMQQQGSSDVLYSGTAQNTAGNKGDYVTTGSAYGQYRPQQANPYSPAGMYGQMYYPGMELGGIPYAEMGMEMDMNTFDVESINKALTKGLDFSGMGMKPPGGQGMEMLENTGGSDDDFTKDIVHHESRGNYKAQNPNSSAAGKYQFLWNTWGGKIKSVTGVSSKKEFLNNPEAQDAFYGWYVENEMKPAVSRLKRYNKKGLSDAQLSKLYHFKGEGGAKQWLTTGVDATAKNNENIPSYIGMEEGGEYELTEEQIHQILADGGEIEFLD